MIPDNIGTAPLSLQFVPVCFLCGGAWDIERRGGDEVRMAGYPDYPIVKCRFCGYVGMVRADFKVFVARRWRQRYDKNWDLVDANIPVPTSEYGVEPWDLNYWFDRRLNNAIWRLGGDEIALSAFGEIRLATDEEQKKFFGGI